MTKETFVKKYPWSIQDDELDITKIRNILNIYELNKKDFPEYRRLRFDLNMLNTEFRIKETLKII